MRRIRRTSLFRRVVSSVSVFSLVVLGLVAPPVVASATPAHHLDQLAPALPAPDIMPIARRMPGPIDAPIAGIAHPSEDAITIPDSTDPEQFAQDFTPLPMLGGPNFTVLANKAGNEHAALVWAGDHNVKKPDGSWVPGTPALTADGYGWSYQTDGAVVHFPKALDSATAVKLDLPAGTVAVAPSGTKKAPGVAATQSVTYAAALPLTDFNYSLVTGGYKETIVLASGAGTSLSWDIRTTGSALSLAKADDGGIVVSAAGEQVASMPAPVINDAAGLQSVGTFALSTLSGGHYQLALAIDPAFLASATYPITIDPSDRSLSASKDTWVNQNQPTQSNGNDPQLKVQKGSGQKRAFIAFDTSGIQRPNRLVYKANVKLYVESRDPGSNVDAAQVTQTWSQGVNWNQQPTAGPVIDTDGSSPGSYSTFHMDPVYQHYIGGSAPDYGVRLVSGSSGDKTIFSSSEASSHQPALEITFNDLPDKPVAKSPVQGDVVENDSPALRVTKASVSDRNGDEVMLRFQVADSPAFTNIVAHSNFTEERTFGVSAGVLLDGRTYYWRAQARDVCPTISDPNNLCSLIDGAGVTHDAVTSDPVAFTIALSHLGMSWDYPMWTQDIGNGVSFGVNESNGNLAISVPLDSLSTEMGDVSFGLSYNSEDPDNDGIGQGWMLYVGPSGAETPVSLRELHPVPDGGARITFADGSRGYFSLRDEEDGSYAPAQAGLGDLYKNPNGTFDYQPADGGDYVFDAAGLLKTVRLAGTKNAAAKAGKVLSYAYNAVGRVKTVTAPNGVIGVTWSTNTTAGILQSLQTWDNRTFSFSLAGSALSVANPAGETVRFLQPGLVSEIQDGAITALGHQGWQVGYSNSAPTNGYVTTIRPPVTDSGTDPWMFTYDGPFLGKTAAQGTVTDPRGYPTSDPNDFQTATQFNTQGHPILVTGPADQFGYRPITTMQWDGVGNQTCARSPEANAIALQTVPANCASDDLSSIATYSLVPPYPLIGTTQAAAEPGGSRLQESFQLDGEGHGLKLGVFPSTSQDGIAASQSVFSTALSRDFTSSPPAGVTGDGWSLRLTGYLTTSVAGSYRFQLYSHDGIRFVVDDQTLVNCFGSAQNFSYPNCGTRQSTPKAKITLPPGTWPMMIKFYDKNGGAKFDLQWNGGSGGSFSTIPSSVLLPNLNLQARSVATSDAPTQDATTTYQNADMFQRLPNVQTQVSPLASAPSRPDTMNWDNTGRLSSETNASGTTSYVYSQPSQCASETQGPLPGAETDQVCNARGDVTHEVVTVPLVPATGQIGQTRVTDFVYDQMGRTKTEDTPGDAKTTYDYDASGRVKTQDQVLNADEHAVTSYVYDDAGRLVTQTNPDGGIVNYNFDEVGNQTSSSDPRNAAWLTVVGYDGQNREVSQTSPSRLVSLTEYRLQISGSYVNTRAGIDPAGVQTVTTMDALGRETSTRTGTLNASHSFYDASGNLTRSVDPAGVVTRDVFDSFGDVIEEHTPSPDGSGEAVTSYKYDASGNQSQMDGPHPGAGDVLNFTYDEAGNLKNVQQVALPAPNMTSYSYDAAGELVKVDQPMAVGESQVRKFTYDLNGNKVTSTDFHGTTTFSYDAANRLTDELRPNGYEIFWQYDLMGHVLNKHFESEIFGGPRCRNCFIAQQFDLAGNMTYNNRDGIYINAVDYDSDGRQIRVVEDTSGQNPQGHFETDYVYNPSTGQLDEIHPGRWFEFMIYDANGQLEGFQVEIRDTPPSIFGYDSAGRLQTRTDPSGVVWNDTYNQAGLPESRTVTGPSGQLAHFALGYDSAGNVTTRTEEVAAYGGGDTAGSGTWGYEYDQANRMTKVTDPTNLVTNYGYDNAGNRTSVQVGSDPAITTSYDEAGLATSSSDGTVYTNDAVGNLVGLDKPNDVQDRCFFYDGFDNLHSMSLHSTTGCSRGEGSRVYSYDGLDRLTDVGTPLQFYVGTSQNLAAVGSRDLYYFTQFGPFGDINDDYITDLHGDVVGQVDAFTGEITGSKLYSPWGEPAAQTGAESILGFQGQQTNADTGYVDMQTRLYDPAQGRFTTMDTLFGDTSDPASMNQFGYVEGNPVTASDRSGMYACQTFLNTDFTMTKYKCKSKDGGPGAGIAEQADIYVTGGEYSPAKIYWAGFLKVTKDYPHDYHYNLYVNLKDAESGSNYVLQRHCIFKYEDIKDKDWHGCVGPTYGVDVDEYPDLIPFCTEVELLYGTTDTSPSNLGWVRRCWK